MSVLSWSSALSFYLLVPGLESGGRHGLLLACYVVAVSLTLSILHGPLPRLSLSPFIVPLSVGVLTHGP